MGISCTTDEVKQRAVINHDQLTKVELVGVQEQMQMALQSRGSETWGLWEVGPECGTLQHC